MTKALVLSSGGLDSTTCAALAVKNFGAENVATLSIFYGQRHAKELEAARNVAEFYNVAHYELDAAEIFKRSNSALLDKSDAPLDKSSYAAQIKNSPRIATYVPFRNGLMLAMATSFADGLFDTSVELHIGVHSDDVVGSAYADCRADFIAAMQDAVGIGTYDKVKLIAPFLNRTKADVVKIGLELGAPYGLTWSCYAGGDIPCGQCATCLDRARAFELNGVADPALT